MRALYCDCRKRLFERDSLSQNMLCMLSDIHAVLFSAFSLYALCIRSDYICDSRLLLYLGSCLLYKKGKGGCMDFSGRQCRDREYGERKLSGTADRLWDYGSTLLHSEKKDHTADLCADSDFGCFGRKQGMLCVL